MTVVVAFNCSDGVVVAADSMITPSLGGMSVGHHHGLKISVLSGPQLFAFAGDQGQADRFRVMANGLNGLIAQALHPLSYSIAICKAIIEQFQSTGIGMDRINANTILAFAHGGSHHCCVFEGPLQPRLLDKDHFYVALGSGKMSADPFLRFLVDVFCVGSKQPSVREGVFLATWAVQHVIETNPGGVAGPIRVGTFDTSDDGTFHARSLPNDEIAEHQQAIESAAEALRSWRNQLQSGAAAQDIPAPPEAPQI